MRVDLYREPQIAAWSLYVTEYAAGKSFAFETIDGQMVRREVSEGGSVQPFVRFPNAIAREVLTALATELQREGFASVDPNGVLAATRAHLDDAKSMRDRLLVLAEKPRARS